MQQITKSNRVIFDQGLIDERNYWIAQLTPVCEASKLDLEPAGARPQHSEFNPEAISLNGEIYQRLAQLTGGGPFLTYTILMTAVSICLQRYTGDSRVVIGSPSLNESGGLGAGNTLAIVTDVDPQVSFRQQLVSMRQTLLEAYERQNYPFKLLLASKDPLLSCPDPAQPEAHRSCRTELTNLTFGHRTNAHHPDVHLPRL